MKRLATLAGLVFASLIGAFAFTAPAHAAPTCTAYTDSSGTYPADSTGHQQTCFAATSTDKIAIATAVRELPRGANQAYSVVSKNGGASAGTIFYFQNRADAVSYFSQAPYNSYSYATEAGKGHCGFTYAGPIQLVTGIFQTCAYDGITPNSGTNPDLNHTVKHEMGHAYDADEFVLQGHTASGTVGYSTSTTPPNYIQAGLNALKPANWSSLSTTAKATVVCSIWSNIVISPLERSLIVGAGKTDPGAGASVCVTSGPTMIVTPFFAAMDPIQIAQAVEPYFVNTAAETWAESFAVDVGVTTPPSPGFLQLSDKIFINNNFKCAVMDVHAYVTTGLPPTQAVINAHSCSFTPSQL